MININYLNNNTSNDKKIIKSQSTTNIDKDFYMEVFSKGMNKLMLPCRTLIVQYGTERLEVERE